jgi:hypothetical protein
MEVDESTLTGETKLSKKVRLAADAVVSEH